MREPQISRDQALELAREAAETMDRDVRDVVSVPNSPLGDAARPCIYNVDLSDCWIAYLASRMVGLGPSHIASSTRGPA